MAQPSAIPVTIPTAYRPNHLHLVPVGPPGSLPSNSTVGWSGSINFFTGIWLLASPFVLGVAALDGRMTATVAVLGVIAAAIGVVRATIAHDMSWLSWVNVAVGLVLVLSAFVFSGVTQIWLNNLIVGVSIMSFAAISALVSSPSWE